MFQKCIHKRYLQYNCPLSVIYVANIFSSQSLGNFKAQVYFHLPNWINFLSSICWYKMSLIHLLQQRIYQIFPHPPPPPPPPNSNPYLSSHWVEEPHLQHWPRCPWFSGRSDRLVKWFSHSFSWYSSSFEVDKEDWPELRPWWNQSLNLSRSQFLQL